MSRNRARGRWEIAYWVNKIPGRCWADLMSWALRWPGYSLWAPRRDACRQDAALNGACYCGQTRSKKTLRELGRG